MSQSRYPCFMVGLKSAAQRIIQYQKAAVERELGDDGRVLIRASGTEPVLRVMVEARDKAVARGFAERLAEAAKAA